MPDTGQSVEADVEAVLSRLAALRRELPGSQQEVLDAILERAAEPAEVEAFWFTPFIESYAPKKKIYETGATTSSGTTSPMDPLINQ